MNRGTLTQLFFTTVDRHAGLAAAFRSKVGGAWVSITHREALERVQAISLGLRELGIRPGDKVAIISENRPEWALSDYACLCARATDVPIYPTLTAKQTEYILRDSESVAAFCSTTAQVDKVLEAKSALPGLKHVVAFDSAAAAQRPGVTALAALEAKGRAAAPGHPQWKQEALTAQPDDLATLIYTSGTTGDPKGVMLSHHNIWSNVQAVLQMIPIGSGDECLSMLPLSHSYERMVDYTLFQAGVIINFAESFDTVATNLGEAKPTVVLSVPRLYEKVYAPCSRTRCRAARSSGRFSSGRNAPASNGQRCRSPDCRFPVGWPSRRRSPTASCSRSCRRAPAGASASSSRARHRSRPTSRSSSTAPDCPSSRGTGSPSHRPC